MSSRTSSRRQLQRGERLRVAAREGLRDRHRPIGEVGLRSSSVSSTRSPARSRSASSASRPATPPPATTTRCRALVSGLMGLLSGVD